MFFSAAGEMGYFSRRRWCHLLVWEMSCAITFSVSAASLSSPSVCNAFVLPGGSMHRSGLFFQAFSHDCFLDLEAEEHRKHLNVRVWGCLLTTTTTFVSRETLPSQEYVKQKVLEFCSLLTECLKTVLCLSCFYLCMKSGGGN